MLIAGKEIVTIDNKNFIHISDAMQVIAPTASSAARWFKQHREMFTFEKDFMYSDDRYPGKKGRIWLTMPEGFQALYQACVDAPRLKIVEGVEERVAPFWECGLTECSDKDPDEDGSEQLHKFSEARPTIGAGDSISYTEVRERMYGMSGVDMLPSKDEGQRTEQEDDVCDDEVEIEFATEQIEEHNEELSKPSIVEHYDEPEERIYGMRHGMSGYTEEGKQTLINTLEKVASNFGSVYHAKMNCMDKVLNEGPFAIMFEEIQDDLAKLPQILHDNLVTAFVKEIVSILN